MSRKEEQAGKRKEGGWDNKPVRNAKTGIKLDFAFPIVKLLYVKSKESIF